MKILTILAKIHDEYVNHTPKFIREALQAALILSLAWWVMNGLYTLLFLNKIIPLTINK